MSEVRSPAPRSPAKGVGVNGTTHQINLNDVDWIQVEDLDDDLFAAEGLPSPSALNRALQPTRKRSVDTENTPPTAGILYT
jgi:hypothetical protein